MDPVILAERIAREAHAGQVRRGGQPYIEHPRRVAEAMPDRLCKAVAWLHDMLEDCAGWDASRLYRMGVESTIVRSVEILTRRPGQEYQDYLSGITNTSIALRVKIADIVDNLTDHPTGRQVAKCRAALTYLAGLPYLP